ncbi:MAG TPA: hypothetical protein VLT33_07565 [Labilithrix sp.]|nr:hypothetical protein [Labilithrix sp.]
MSDLEPLPPDLRELFGAEREAYPADDAARARVMRRLEAAIAFGAVGAATTAAVAAKTGLLAQLGVHVAKHTKLWLALAFAGGIALGETHARLTTPPPAPVVVAPAATAVAAPVSTPSAASAASVPPAIPLSALPNLPSPPAAVPCATPPPSAAPSDLAAEQTLIDTSRSALARGRASDALRAADDHARQFPRGRLAEERETMAIQALLLLGRRGDAEARAQRFHKAYPGSLYGNAVDALLAAPRDAGDR